MAINTSCGMWVAIVLADCPGSRTHAVDVLADTPAIRRSSMKPTGVYRSIAACRQDHLAGIHSAEDEDAFLIFPLLEGPCPVDAILSRRPLSIQISRIASVINTDRG